MITKQDGTETLYDLTAVDDVAAWETHEVRHHRKREPRNPIHRALGVLTMLFAAGSLLHAGSVPSQASQPAPTSTVEIPLSAPQTSGVPDTPTIIDDRAQARSSRDQARQPLPPKPEPDKIEQVIAWAMAQQGKPYRFGAAGPRAFDCSGLVMQAFAQVGIKLPHYTGTMVKYGKKISRTELKRGDILFPTSGHVVIYLGDGKQLAASSGKGKVVIQNVTGFYAARRLL